ncbi:MAG: retropepsin-like aspartic protease [Myxococcota bacterium]|nr:retropepsin-like aspartic protease [Myxococcota bacterium]
MPSLLLAPALLIAAHLAILAGALIAGAGAEAGRPLAGVTAAAAVVFVPVLAGFLRAPRVLVPVVMAGWSLLLLVLLPAILPQAPAALVNQGFGLACGECQGVGERVYAVLPDLGGASLPAAPPALPPSPAAARPAAPPPLTDSARPEVEPSVTASPAHGDIVIQYETQGNSIIVPVTFEGGRTIELPMLFDTGATLTTLDQAALDALGLRITADAPIITTQTAAGPKRSPIALISAISIDGHRISNVTLSRCAACSTEQARGLLGMNVSGRFLITIDTSSQQLTLRPRSGGETKDVEAWLELASSAVVWPDGRIEITLSGKNRAPIPVGRAVLSVHCDAVTEGILDSIPPGQTTETTISMPAGTDCTNYRVKVSEASW